ncbi:MAG TPA: type II secretion system F family protein [bacterium]|nr:type II secretion system F family protein [bacterium]HNS49123.1 type II secretion system F family protein [bacterium]
MPVFSYQALNVSGEKVSGTLTAGSRSELLEAIGRQGLRPVSVKEIGAEEAPAGVGIRRRLFSRTAGSQTGVEAFTRQLANLLAAGVPLSRSLDIVTRETSAADVRQQWNTIRNDIKGGLSFATALSKWPRSFPPVYVAIVRAGETGGFLNLALEQIADFRAREHDLKGRVKAALVYPVLLAGLAGVVLIFLMTYFIPRFSAIFSEFGGSLPWLTRLIMNLSRWLVGHGLILAAAAVAGIISLRRALATETGQRVLERTVLKLPGIGTVVARFALVRFSRMLGTLLGAGVPLVLALNVAREAIGNRTLSDAVTRAVENVKSGSSLAMGLASSERLFPPSVVEMVAVAEESGNLNKELIRLATSYENDLDRQLRMLVSVIEPVLLFLTAGIVGTVVIGMLLPVFTLQDLIR